MPHTALVVEDDPAIRRLVGKLLARNGIEYDTAPDGRQAVEKLRANRYSVVVLDLMVPETNGFEVIEIIKKERMNVPVAVVSAVSQQALTNLDLDIVKLVISKPFDVDEFTKGILEICADHSLPSELGSVAVNRVAEQMGDVEQHPEREPVRDDPAEERDAGDGRG
ncbi:MAG: response regulator [Acidobacteria bacterium]|nr:response regulator [Acidobacteriota bacterium]